MCFFQFQGHVNEYLSTFAVKILSKKGGHNFQNLNVSFWVSSYHMSVFFLSGVFTVMMDLSSYMHVCVLS